MGCVAHVLVQPERGYRPAAARGPSGVLQHHDLARHATRYSQMKTGAALMQGGAGSLA